MAGLDPAATFADLLRRDGSMTEAEIEKLLSNAGRVVAAESKAEGEDHAVYAAPAAIVPFLENDSIKKARGVSKRWRR
jgi:hypothetical protein